jgi:hypothetical protein
MKKVQLQLGQVHSRLVWESGEQGTAETWSVDRLGELQPDVVVIDKAGKTICILEYT